MKDIKLAFKYMKYGYNKKTYIIMSTIFFIMGLVQLLRSDSYVTAITGGYMLILAPMMTMQLIQTALMSGLVLSSAKKKDLQTRVLSKFTLMVSILSWIVLSIIMYISTKINTNVDYYLGTAFLLIGIMSILFLTYFSISYKFFIPSTVVFFIVFFAIFISVRTTLYNVVIPDTIGFISGFVCLLVGNVIYTLLNKLTYRIPMDKKATASILKNKA